MSDMKVEVRYFSRGGNTRRLAEAVAKALNVKALPVEEPMTGPADMVFLCASVYGGMPDKQVLTFIRQNARDIGQIAVLSTSASGKSTYGRIKAAAEDMGVKVNDNFFHCPGAWTLFHKGRPNQEDCERAAGFARALVK